MSTSRNGKVWMYGALTLFGLGGAGGGISFMRSVSPADVSKQIAVESPYPLDRLLIMHQLANHSKLIDALTKTMSTINDSLHEVKAALGRIETKVDNKVGEPK